MSEPFRKEIKKKGVRLLVTQITTGKHKDSYRVQGHGDDKWTTYGVYKNLNKAINKANIILDLQLKGGGDMAQISSHEIAMLRYMRAHNITFAELEQVALLRDSLEQQTLAEVLKGWSATRLNSNLSAGAKADTNLLVSKLQSFFEPKRLFHTIQATDFALFVASNNWSDARQQVIRSYLNVLCDWAIMHKAAIENESKKTNTIKIKAKSGGHEVLTPGELVVLLRNISEPFQNWLVISAFAGLRGGEICGVYGRKDDRLTWGDFDWKNRRILVRPETSKTNTHRIVPICDALWAWLEKHHGKRIGFVHEAPSPSYSQKNKPAETTRLGGFIGGWKKNCLRASRASYRLVETDYNYEKTATEDGHTVATLKKNYNNPRFQEDAVAWFSLTPDVVNQKDEDNVVGFE